MKLAFIGLGRMGLKSVADYGIGKEIKKKKSVLYSYAKGSKGPKELEAWSRKNRVRWKW